MTDKEELKATLDSAEATLKVTRIIEIEARQAYREADNALAKASKDYFEAGKTYDTARATYLLATPQGRIND